MREHHFISEYQSSGAAKIVHNEVCMAAVLGLAAYIPECLMAQLMSDARLLQQVDVLTSLLSDKCSFLEKLSAAFWERLASV
eukprot:3895495-Amphidinium_carterae.1